MGLPSVAGLISSLLGSPDPSPPSVGNKSGLSLVWLDKAGSTQSLRFDAVSSETHESLLTLTDHPVEVGANVVDNAREMPDTITIEGFISSKPLRSNPGMAGVLPDGTFDLNIPKKDLQLSVTSAIGALGDLIDPGPSSATAQVATSDFPNRLRATYETLRQMQKDRSLASVVSGMTTALSMMVTRVGAARTLADGTGATFHVELRKVRLVSSETVDAPEPTEKRGMIAADAGSQGTKDANAGKTQKSLAVKAATALGLRK